MAERPRQDRSRRSGGSRGGKPHRKPHERGRERSGGSRRDSGGERGRSGDGRRRKAWDVSSGQLPNWVADELARTTPKAKLAAATAMLQDAAEAFAGGKHGRSLKLAQQAKELSPRDATVRELLALSAYRLGRWEQSLRELRTYRRYTGDSTHLAVEMDVLRAMDRPADVDAAWELLGRLGASREARNEAKVVYAAHLLDRGEPRRAWEVVNPGRIGVDPSEGDLRVWYVASRTAAELGDRRTARKLFEAIQKSDPAFPALDELDRETR